MFEKNCDIFCIFNLHTTCHPNAENQLTKTKWCYGLCVVWYSKYFPYKLTYSYMYVDWEVNRHKWTGGNWCPMPMLSIAFCWNQRNWYAIYKLDRIEMVKIMNTCVSGANMSKSDCQLRWECQMAITKMIITENVRFTNQFCRTWWHFLAASRQDNINEILLSNPGGSKWHLEMFLLVIFLMDVPRKFCFDYYSLLGAKSGKNVRNG